MFCPHSVVHDGNYVYVLRHERSDYYSGAPISERLNPLRYEITFFPRRPYLITLNKDAWLNLKWANFNWHLWRKHLVRK